MDLHYRVAQGAVGQTWRLFLQDVQGAPVRGLGDGGEAAALHLLRDTEAKPRVVDPVPARVGEWRSGGLCEVDPDRMPGLYELSPPDALFAEGARSAMALIDLPPALPQVVQVELVAYDPYDPFALRLANFIRSTCHSHLSSAFYRVMPPSVRPMMDLLLDPPKGAAGSRDGSRAGRDHP